MAAPVVAIPVAVRVAVLLLDDVVAWGLGFAAAAVVVLMLPVAVALLGFGAILALLGGGLSGMLQGVGAAAGQAPVTAVVAEVAAATLPPAGGISTASRGVIPGWSDRPAFNQYHRGNYRSAQSWLAWRDASCSAASLAWLLGAYGKPLGSIDDAIALIGPNTGISTSLGLLDARAQRWPEHWPRRGSDRARRCSGPSAPFPI